MWRRRSRPLEIAISAGSSSQSCVARHVCAASSLLIPNVESMVSRNAKDPLAAILLFRRARAPAFVAPPLGRFSTTTHRPTPTWRTLKRQRTRFASPTGSPHVGGARTALFSWLRAADGDFIIRVELGQRGRRASQASVLQDLRWLGLMWDEGPEVGGEKAVPPVRADGVGVYQARRPAHGRACVPVLLHGGGARPQAEGGGGGGREPAVRRHGATPTRPRQRLDAGDPYGGFKVPRGKKITISDPCAAR